MIRLAFALAATAALGLATSARADEDEGIDPKTIDLAKLIACDGYDVPHYNALAFWLTGDEGDEARRRLGLTEERQGNFMLKQYRLKAPLTVFGRKVSRIAFTSGGVLAVFDEADPRPLARELGIKPMIDAPGKFLGDKTIKEAEEKADGGSIVWRTKVSLNVSTVTTHPGKTLAGCSYRIDTD